MHLDWFNFLNMGYVAQTSMLTASVLLAILNVASEYVYFVFKKLYIYPF